MIIDYNRIISKNMPIQDILSKPPKADYVGLYINIPKEYVERMKGMPKGSKRLSYLNSKEFIKNIKGHCYFVYNPKLKTCEVIYTGVGDDVCKGLYNDLLHTLPHDVSIITNKGTFINDRNVRGGSNRGGDGVIHLNQTLAFKLDSDTIEYFRDISQRGNSLNKDGTISQKELIGSLDVIGKEGDVLVLGVDVHSIFIGNSEDVKPSTSKFSFHTHPREAYEKHETNIGWPSCKDYIAFLSTIIRHKCIMHLVVAIEGIYIISLSPDMIGDLKDMDKKVISRQCNAINNKSKPIQEYIDGINNITYKGNYVFDVDYVEWG